MGSTTTVLRALALGSEYRNADPEVRNKVVALRVRHAKNDANLSQNKPDSNIIVLIRQNNDKIKANRTTTELFSGLDAQAKPLDEATGKIVTQYAELDTLVKNLSESTRTDTNNLLKKQSDGEISKAEALKKLKELGEKIVGLRTKIESYITTNEKTTNAMTALYQRVYAALPAQEKATAATPEQVANKRQTN